MALTLDQLKSAIASGQYVEEEAPGPGITGLWDYNVPGYTQQYWHLKDDPQGLQPGYFTAAKITDGGDRIPFQEGMTGNELTPYTHGDLLAMTIAAPKYGTSQNPGWSQDFGWSPGLAGAIANLAPMVISSGIGAGISSIGGWGNLLDSIRSGLSGTGDGLYGLELGGEGVGQALDTIPEYLDPTTGGYTGELGQLDPWAQEFAKSAFPQQNLPGATYPWLDASGNLDVDKFLQMTGPGGDFASAIPGGVEGVPGLDTLGSTNSLQSLLNTLGSNPTGALKTLLTKDGGSSSSFANYLSDLTGIPSSVLSGIFGGAGALSQILGRNAQNAANQQLLSSNRSPAFSAHLAPTAFAGPGRGKSLGQVMRYARGGLTQANEFGQGNEAGWGDEANLGYARGGTAGQDDKVPAMLSHGEYVFDADTVAALGDGNNEAGAGALDRMRENIRRHKRSAPPSKIPPKAKAPEQYLKGAK